MSESSRLQDETDRLIEEMGSGATATVWCSMDSATREARANIREFAYTLELALVAAWDMRVCW